MKSTIEIRELASKASHNITSRLVWHTALKDQAGIAQSLADGKDIQEIYGLGEAALFDEFFCFLDQLGIKPLAMKLKPKIKKRETGINFLTVFLIYVMRIVSGFPHFWNIQPVLLQSQPLMHLVGFNAREIREGTSERGLRGQAKVEKQASDQGNIAVDAAPAGDLAADTAVAILPLPQVRMRILLKRTITTKSAGQFVRSSFLRSSAISSPRRWRVFLTPSSKFWHQIHYFRRKFTH